MHMSTIPWLDENIEFPPLNTALDDPNGLIAAGGDLSQARLLAAYQQGIFPWYSEDQPLLWWSPDPRCIVFPDQAEPSKSLRKFIRKSSLELSFNRCFAEVIVNCARLDKDDGTWITEEMEHAYIALHQNGYAHSVEVWQDGELAGGLYGLAIGRCFFGESMFSRAPNTSKVAFMALCRQLHRWRYELIDCQVENPHLLSLGAHTIERTQFSSILKKSIAKQPAKHAWRFEADMLQQLANR